MVEERYIRHYWGKAQPQSDDGPRCHPLAYHCLDVAAAADALLDERPGLAATLAHVSGLDAGTARRWLLFALALHDLGKFTDCFQTKAPEHWTHKQAWASGGPIADPGHGWTGVRLWRSSCRASLSAHDDFIDLFGPRTRATQSIKQYFDRWMDAAFGHHGRPVAGKENWQAGDYICGPALDDARDYVCACARLFDVGQSVKLPEDGDHRGPVVSWLVAGLGMVSDWVGSNQEWFGYHRSDHTLDQYWKIARRHAADAIAKSGLGGAAPAARYGLAEALGVEPIVQAAPRSPLVATPLQAWADSVEIRGASIVVIEDLTGAGKTEAALITAQRLMRAGVADGLYWALPTMATADALYLRLARSFGHFFADPGRASLVLAHSARDFNDVFRKSIALGERAEAPYQAGRTQSLPSRGGPAATDGHDGADEITASAACTRWLADDRRKTFLADVGVGTIDQALLAVLPTKHQALRLAGLSRRVLVIDEVHSLDAYQGTLVEALLRFHAALGGSAILVSATLTRKARQKLVAAFAQGAGWKKRTLDDPSFPSASIVDAQGVRVDDFRTTIETGARRRGTLRDLPVRRVADVAGAVQVLGEAARNGLAAVWVRNTVQDALDAFLEVRATLPGVDAVLFHARFALGDRLRIQEGVLGRYGKAGTPDRRRAILIATQVVEQSLDCDWDVMISDLAPIDLLLQRAGRLHRHDERGPRPAPVLHVVGPESVPDAGAAWYETAFPRAAFVYPHHAQLWATMRLMLKDGLPRATKNQRDFLEQIYDGDERAWPAALVDASRKALVGIMSARATAGLNALDLRRGFMHQAGAWEADTHTPTRLGEKTRVLRLYRWDGQRLEPWWRDAGRDRRREWRLSEVSVLARRVSDVITDDAALKRAVAAEVATWPDRFEPPLLVPLVEAGGEDWTAAINADRGQCTPDLRRGQLLYSPTFGLRLAIN